jgi:hypothetical protein
MSHTQQDLASLERRTATDGHQAGGDALIGPKDTINSSFRRRGGSYFRENLRELYIHLGSNGGITDCGIEAII